LLLLLTREPGLHLREMPRRLGVSLRTVRYHLDRLEHEHLVHPHRAGRFVRWFRPGDFSVAERALISAARVRGQRLILEQMALNRSVRWVDLVNSTRLSKASLSWHLRALAELSIVAPDADGRYRLVDPAGVAMGLAVQKESVAATVVENAREIFERTP
jgi:predicted transcriptional regulator